MGWRDTVRDRLDDVDVLGSVRRARHLVRTGFGRTDRRLAAAYLAGVAVPKLHLGCGTRLLDGWLNTDLTPRTLESIRVDATRPLPFADGSFAYVYSEHMIEHVDHLDGRRLLTEFHRVLRPGGRLRVATPDLDGLLGLFVPEAQRTDLQRRYIALIVERHVPGVDASTTNPVFVLNNNVRDWGHRFLYDEATLRAELTSAGFVAVTRHELQTSDDPVLRGLANDTRMPPGLVDFETMTFEAVRP